MLACRAFRETRTLNLPALEAGRSAIELERLGAPARSRTWPPEGNQDSAPSQTTSMKNSLVSHVTLLT